MLQPRKEVRGNEVSRIIRVGSRATQYEGILPKEYQMKNSSRKSYYTSILNFTSLKMITKEVKKNHLRLM